MIYKIQAASDPLIENAYKKAMAELNEFFGINWTKNCPRVFVMDSRKTIDALHNEKTADWIIGWSEKNDIFLLDNEKMETESCHKKFSEQKYTMHIKHELSHAFYKILAGQGGFPRWLWEGTSIYTAGECEVKPKPDKFTDFLDFYEPGATVGVYREAGFAVKALVEKFGKEKLLGLIKSLKEVKTKPEFEAKFKEVYGFDLTYKEFNNL